MIVGKDFAEELLKLLNITNKECIVKLNNRKGYSETLYKAKGISKIILCDDDSKTSSIITAAHEVGHFINNRNNYKQYLIFKLGNLVLFSIVILAILLVGINQYIYKIPLWILCGIMIISFFYSILLNTIKINDESGANKEALKVLSQYADIIFTSSKDCRKWELIRSETMEQLESGLQKYKNSSWIVYILGLSPTIVYILLWIFN
ncbi:zinc metallopeptidase [Sporosarcina sp. FA15]|uniref:zinc metallopeptidase n=1 Tax=Sporosarcina sp. FA15 TaxID=3413031 RepID=UPI003F657DC3